MNLEELGWSSFFELQLSPDEKRQYAPARVAEEQKNTYRLIGQYGEWMAEVSGKMRYQAVERANLPVVGDWVVAQAQPEEKRATIHRIFQRKSKFSRKEAGERTSEQIIAANIDMVFVMTSLNRDLNLRRIERYLALIWESGARPVVLLNKADLCTQAEQEALRVESISAGAPLHVISALTGQGMDNVIRYLRTGQTVSLLGSSGVGKSTLVNRLVGKPIQKVQAIRDGDDRGRHTTSSRQLIFLPQGGIILDTPGLRELQLWDAEGGLRHTFQDVGALAIHCRFRDCQHATEPGCAVQQALRDGALEPDRLASYQKLKRELSFLARKQDELASFLEKKKLKKIHRQFKRGRNRW